MTQPALAITVANRGRHYHHPDGRLVPSVTNVIGGVYDKSAPLMWWAAERVVSAIAAEPDRFVAEMAADPDKATRAWKGVWRQERDDAADRGTSMHDWLHTAIEGRDVAEVEARMDTATRAFLPACEAFMTAECPVGRCEVTRIGEHYGGTCDFIGLLNSTGDRHLLCDWKTRNNGKHDVYDSEVLQLAALRYADFDAHLGQDGPVYVTAEKPDGAAVVTFNPWAPGKRTLYRVHDKSLPVNERAHEAFDALRVVREWQLDS